MASENSSNRSSLINTIIVIVLQGITLVGITTNTIMVKENNRKTERMWSDYVPMVLLEGMIENSNYQIEEIVATINGIDKVKIKEINEKYYDFQKLMLNVLQKQRGGVTSVTRDAKSVPLDSEAVIRRMK
jgi:hypothetical protein